MNDLIKFKNEICAKFLRFRTHKKTGNFHFWYHGDIQKNEDFGSSFPYEKSGVDISILFLSFTPSGLLKASTTSSVIPKLRIGNTAPII